MLITVRGFATFHAATSLGRRVSDALAAWCTAKLAQQSITSPLMYADWQHFMQQLQSCGLPPWLERQSFLTNNVAIWCAHAHAHARMHG